MFNLGIVSNYTAEIIALCALVFTIWQAFTQRKYNRISVKPHLSQINNRDKNNNDARLQVMVTNNGLGPAFINKFQIYFNGVECDDAEKAVKNAIGNITESYSFSTLGDESAMAQNETKSILSVAFQAQSWREIEEVEKKLSQLDMVINYSSAYGNKYVLDSRE